MEYVCKGCDYKTIYQTNYKKHLETKKHKAKMAEPFVCKYCSKEFKFRQSMYRHIKYTCKKNMDVVTDDVKDLVRLLKQEQDKREELQKQIEQLSEKLEQNIKI